MSKISTVKALREFCATHQLDAGLRICKRFVDQHYKESFLDKLKAEIMFCGNVVEPIVSSVFAVQESIADQIYLTGSRFFGGATALSDWDFFVQDSTAVTDAIRVQGFYRVSDNWTYLDNDCASVWQKGTIHIQLSRNVGRRLSARNRLKASIGNFSSMDKRKRSQVWNELLL